jgi:hypothetical protein
MLLRIKMKPNKEIHLKQLKKLIGLELEEKYRRGDKEHKDNLLDMDIKILVKELRAELIDALVYLDVINRNLR